MKKLIVKSLLEMFKLGIVHALTTINETKMGRGTISKENLAELRLLSDSELEKFNKEFLQIIDNKATNLIYMFLR